MRAFLAQRSESVSYTHLYTSNLLNNLNLMLCYCFLVNRRRLDLKCLLVILRLIIHQLKSRLKLILSLIHILKF